MGYLKNNNYQNQNRDINNSLNQMGNTFNDIRTSIPHIYIGKDGLSTKKTENIRKEEDKYEKWINKSRNIGFLIAVSLVVIYAAYRIIKLVIGG